MADGITAHRETGMKRVLVFSPDEDLARFLLLNLEDRFCIIREHRLEGFERAIRENSPDLLLIDLYASSEEIFKQLELVRRCQGSIPVIVLRAYKPVPTEIERSITHLTQHIFYKPVQGELITQAIEDTLK